MGASIHLVYGKRKVPASSVFFFLEQCMMREIDVRVTGIGNFASLLVIKGPGYMYIFRGSKAQSKKGKQQDKEVRNLKF